MHVAPSRGMITAKASLTSSLMHFVKGDDVWFSGWFLVPEGASLPFTLADLESPGSRSIRGCGSCSTRPAS